MKPAQLDALPRSLPPRLIGRVAASAYVSVSPAKFDQLVADRRMPRPRCIDRRKAWDVRDLDAAIDRLPRDDAAGDDGDETWADLDASA